MTILRTDKIAGLESVNAITGSVFFDGASIIVVDDSDDFHYGTGDFTVEGWIYATGRNQQMMLIGQWDGNAGSSGTVSWALQLTNDTNGYLRFLISTNTSSVAFDQNASSGGVFDNSWHHFAVTRNGNDYKFFIDGTVVKSFTDSAAIGNATVPLTIGGSSRAYTGGTVPTQMFTGYLSNIRICKGKALYTAAFTPPTRQLEVTSETVLLCCQSSGDMFKEEIGKTLSMDLYTDSSGSSPSTFVPDVGNDHTHGTVLEGNVEFPSLNYMTLPRGTTTQSNRGRGMFISQVGSGNWSNAISYIQIQTLGEVKDFGDLIYPRRYFAGTSSATRGVIGGGVGPSWPSNKTTEYSTLATTGNATSFGELLDEKYGHAGFANSTRGIFTGGYSPSPVSGNVNTMEYITFATTGNALDFGDQTDGSSFTVRYTGSGISNGTRGIIQGGYTGSGYADEIIYVPNIASLSNTSDFGNLSSSLAGVSGCSDRTRGIFFGGYNPANVNTIEYVTIASTGNAENFGDLTGGTGYSAAVSNSIRGVVTLTNGNTINYVTIQTLGNAQDFGDLNTAGGTYGANANFSDSHGGLT